MHCSVSYVGRGFWSTAIGYQYDKIVCYGSAFACWVMSLCDWPPVSSDVGQQNGRSKTRVVLSLGLGTCLGRNRTAPIVPLAALFIQKKNTYKVMKVTNVLAYEMLAFYSGIFGAPTCMGDSAPHFPGLNDLGKL
jgi:hypothetical protein